MWVKLDDAFFRHHKVIAAGRDARDLFLASLCYAANQLTDGFVPLGVLRMLAAEADIDDGRAARDRLLATGLWREVEGGYQIKDYLDYNPSADAVRAKRAATARRVAGWRAAQPGAAADGNAACNGVTNGVGNGVGNTTPVPVPHLYSSRVNRDARPRAHPRGDAPCMAYIERREAEKAAHRAATTSTTRRATI